MKYIAREIKSGIYKIENTVNGKVYVGQSKDINVRISHHFASLRKNSHSNIYLQRAFNKYGEHSFVWEIIEQCNEDELDDKERYYIYQYRSLSSQHGYNIEAGGKRRKSVAGRAVINAKPVILLNTLTIFKSKKDAIQKTNARSLHSHLDGNSRYAGVMPNGDKMIWMYYDDYKDLNLVAADIKTLISKAQENPIRKCKKVICLNTKECFNSCADVREYLGVSDMSVRDAIKGRSHSCGTDNEGNKLVWRYLDDYVDMTDTDIHELITLAQIPNGGRNKRQIICLNTYQIFDSIAKASNVVNIDSACIIRCCKGETSVAGRDPITGERLRWMYYDEYLKAKPNGDESIA